MKWENVSVFISNTFQDMHGERDYLVKEVFPELLAWCESRRLHMYDIDLRWGITREDSTSHNTVAACLHNIDKCRPFFICFLGQRRGWVPGSEDVSSGTSEEYPALPEYLGRTSVTEMEIEHALLAPMNRMYEGVLHNSEPCRRALFYFRTESCLGSIPAEELPVYQDTPENLARIREFKDVIRKGGYPVTEYDCSYERNLNGRGGLDNFTAVKEPLSRVILRQLKEQIAREFPDHMVSDDPGSDQAGAGSGSAGDPAGIQEEFIWREEQSYYPQKDDLDELRRYLLSDERKALCVTGKGGSGKTSLMCALAREYIGSRRFIPRFCGISPDSSDLYSLIAGILAECGLQAPATGQELCGNIDKYLRQIAAQQDTVILLDGLNQCSDGLRLLELLPHRLPEGIKIILSCKEESLDDEILTRIRAYENVRLWPLRTKCDENYKRGMIDRFLSQYLKKLDEDSIQLITHARGSDTPLFISVVLSELRVFGRFAEIEDQIRKFDGNTDGAFSEILSRLESESDEIGGIPLSRAVFGMLSCSRIGLSEEELVSAIHIRTGCEADAIRPLLRVLLRQVRPFLARRGQLYDFFHESFRIAAGAKYSSDALLFHSALADAFCAAVDPEEDNSYQCSSGRPYTEYPYHLVQADRKKELDSLVMDPVWIRNKMEVCGMQALLYDYDLAAGNRSCKLTGEALRLSAPIIMKDPSQLTEQLTGRLHPFKNQFSMIQGLLSELEDSREHFWLKPVNGAFTAPGESGLSFRSGKFAITAMCIHLGDLVCSDEMNRMAFYDRGTGEQLRLIEAEGDIIRCLATDGRLLYAGCGDGTVSVWQTQSGSCFKTLRVSDCALNDLRISENMLYAADESGNCIEYDLKQDEVTQKTATGKYPLLAVDADQGRLCFGGMNQRVELLGRDRHKTVWETGSGYTGKIVLDGSRLVYTTFYPRIFFRNLETGTLRTVDYADGNDFADPNNRIMNEWREKGPYIRDMIRFGENIAVATPFSVAVFPMDGAEEPTETFPCQDARTLSYADGVIYAGNGKGRIFSYSPGNAKAKETSRPTYPITSITRYGRHLAVASETELRLYDTETASEDAPLSPEPNGLSFMIPGFFTDVVPWKGGFTAGSFCEFTLWKGYDETKWSTLHQSLMLQEGINDNESPYGTKKMVPLRDHIAFLTRGHDIFVKTWQGSLSHDRLSGHNDFKRIRLITDTKSESTARFSAIAPLTGTVFAAASEKPRQLLIISGRSDGVSLLHTFPIQDRVLQMESTPDGLLYILCSDNVIKCLNPDTGKERVDLMTGTTLRIRLPGTPVDMAVTTARIYVSLKDGCLLSFDRKTGDLQYVLRSDSDISSLCCYEHMLYAGTETGRLMVFFEQNGSRPGSCAMPVIDSKDDESLAYKEKEEMIREMSGHLSPELAKELQKRAGIGAGNTSGAGADGRRPVRVLRDVPPDKDSDLLIRLRTVCMNIPLPATVLAVFLRQGLSQGWSTIRSAITWTSDNKLIAGFAVVMSILFLLFSVGLNTVHALSADIYYEDTKRWLRSYKLPVLDRYILPLVYILMAVPGILLAGTPDLATHALIFELSIPAMYTLFYFQGIDMFQRNGMTKRLSKDKTFISMEETFYNLRIAGVAIGFLLDAAAIWAVLFHPQWFSAM